MPASSRSISIAISLNAELINEIDTVARAMSVARSGESVGRSEAIRALVRLGLAARKGSKEHRSDMTTGETAFLPSFPKDQS